jgi:1,4-alpha-glucan branching enzyme
LASKPTGLSANTPVPGATIAPTEIERIIHAEHSEPFQVLGPQPVTVDGVASIAIRTFQPTADSVTVIWGASSREIPAKRIHPDGLFEALVPVPSGGFADSIPPAAIHRERRPNAGRI